MKMEIERKFLVTGDDWRTRNGIFVKQGYLNLDKERTVRVRLEREKAFLTIKGITTGTSRAEFEYEIPPQDAEQLLNLCEGHLIEKTRHKVVDAGMTWEIDEFWGANNGLIVAEVELKFAEQRFDKPLWLAVEVTADSRYYNSNLASCPYTAWTRT